ncbi:MAG: primosomal protein N' [Bacteroidia bacterium]|nr:MAG: primosomal protein N' [Bacteroidia bacterium]
MVEKEITYFAEVIIHLALPTNYTWQIPAHLLEKVKIGVRVEVNLGKNKKYAGIVKRIHTESPLFFEAKQILNVLDVTPILHQQQLDLWTWMADYYMCSEGEVLAAAVPSHFKLSSETVLIFNEEYGDDFLELENEEYLLAEALHIKKELKITEAQEILDKQNVFPIIDILIKKNICYVWETVKESYAPKKETYVLLHPKYCNEVALEELLNNDKSLNRAEKQLELLLSFLHLQKTEGIISKSELLKKSNASDAQLKGLVAKNILQIEKRNVDRLKWFPGDININFTLSEAQQKAFESIKENFKEKNTCLIHGVTASGKTEIYIRVIEEYIQHGKQVLYMLPEIALTAQIIRRLQKHFAGYIGVYHSKFSQNERVEIWNKVKDGEVKVIVGARSSIFLPFENLGLIICDEEHDSSFKQMDPAPRYNARDTAIYMPFIFPGCKVLLGSATPSLETYYQAKQNKFGLVTLKERYENISLPEMYTINTNVFSFKKKNKEEQTVISDAMLAAINENLQNKKQIILFQNRRGYTPYQQCNTCGWIPQCKHCAVSLTYHKYQHKLVCHYCGTIYPPLHTCMACGNHDFKQKQFGTERIEEILHELLPHAKIGRMDVDTVRGKNAHHQLIQNFENHQMDIWVGTQMVVKGLDFGNVDMVGIIDADGILSFTDFRVNERAFQLMEQVSGRAGRKSGKGKVYIQTKQANHPVLQLVQQHDYVRLYQMEMEQRSQFHYPPFTKLIKLTFKHKIKEVVKDAAHWMELTLQNKYKNFLVGPSEPIVSRIRDRYLMEILVKLPRQQNIIVQCKKDILEAIAMMHQEQRFKSVVVVPDVDIL